jgi:hypothetical protein
MNKSIALLTDFTVESLTMLKYALKQNENTRLDIILIHGFRSSDSIMDLLFRSKEEDIESLSNDSFTKALQIIRNGHESRIASIKIELISGITSAAIRNHMEALNIHEVYVPKQHPLKLTSGRSFNLVPLLKHTGIKLIAVTLPDTQNLPVKTSLAELLLFE